MDEQILLSVLQAATLLWLIGWCLQGVRDLSRGRVTTAAIAIMIHFIFVGVPLALDLTGNVPLFRNWPTYRYVSVDYTTNLICLFYIAICPPIWWYTTRSLRSPEIRRGTEEIQQRFRRYTRQLNPVLWAILLAPLVLLFFAPDPAAYLDYAVIVREQFGDATFAYHQYMSVATTVALLAAAALVYVANRVWASVVALSPFVLMAVWLNGKRACVVIWLLLLIIVLRMRGQLRGFRLILASVAALVVFITFSFDYQSRYRAYAVQTSEAAYQNFRLDFGRDQGIKMAIYGELHPEYVQILEYRGQSLLFDLMVYIPRSMWPEKPWPYAVYSTAAALNANRYYLGWGVTTSWLEEAIANFGWLGLLLGPLLITLVARLGDSTGEPLASFLTKLVVALLLAVQMAAWMVLAFLWGAAVWRARRIVRRDETRTRRVARKVAFPAIAPGAANRPSLLPPAARRLHPGLPAHDGG